MSYLCLLELIIYELMSRFHAYDELFSNLKPAHVKQKLQKGEDGHVDVDFWLTSTLLAAVVLVGVEDLAAKQARDKEQVGGPGDHLGVHEGHRDPVVTPQRRGVLPERVHFLQQKNQQLGTTIDY
jgi:hypothetical protein